VPYVTQCFEKTEGVIVVASDYVKEMADSIDREHAASLQADSCRA
jgi:pyruvate dehydrogenase complex dehydrogenase (E1) component